MPKFVKQIEINLRHLSEDDEVISKQVENGEGWSGKPDITLKTSSIWDIIMVRHLIHFITLAERILAKFAARGLQM